MANTGNNTQIFGAGLGTFERRLIILTACSRAFFFAALTILLDALVTFGTAPLVVALSSMLGALVATRLAFSMVHGRGALTALALLWVGVELLFGVLGLIPGRTATQLFLSYNLLQHLHLMLVAGSFAAVTTWLFWRADHMVTFELLVGAACAILLFAGHRDFHFDTPLIINSMAWQLGVSELWLLVGLGVTVVAIATMYLLISSYAIRPAAGGGVVVRRYRGRAPYLQWALGGVLLTLLGSFVVRQVYNHYFQIAQARTANGVGQESREGMSPLDFNSSIGRSHQPLALVRLDGDYRENPLTPKLYFREGVLSELQGTELVNAARRFDPDLNRSGPLERYVGQEDPELRSRVPVVQSIYLLAVHENAFAIDVPITINQIKNPNPNRFKATYKAYSMAPGFSMDEMLGAEVGDNRWTAEDWEHYTRRHPDPRYQELAERLSHDEQGGVAKAWSIVHYLNKNSTYTLTPNHTVKPGEDKVAPFLFGDMRGFCVHFAHATVAMLRGIGIPSRVATGYATDLREAKDGHILLRTNDRHAWAEVYVRGFGWVPFDTDPEKVESHAEAPVDKQVLEELMGMLGTEEEILPEDVAKDEKNAELPHRWTLPSWQQLGLGGLAVVLFLVAVKLYLRFSWWLPGSATWRIRRAYISMAARLVDLGVERQVGETRAEYAARLRSVARRDVLPLTEQISLLAYGPPGSVALDGEGVRAAVATHREGLRGFSWWRRVLGVLNPASIATALFGGRW